MNKDPQEWQEDHSPTVQTVVIVSQSPRRVKAGPRRRAAEDRLWNGFTEDETRAAEELCQVWNYLALGMTARAQTYERTDRGEMGAGDIALYLVQTHRRWRNRLKPVERSVVQAVLFEGLSVREAAKAYRRSNAWPRQAIGRCLNKWIELRGWA